MKKLLILALCFSPLSAMADSKAVQDINYRITTGYESSDIDSDVNLTGEIRLPIYSNIGLTLTTGIAINNRNENSASSETQFAGLGLFFKKHDLGKLEMRYDYFKTIDESAINSPEMKTNTLELNGSYYFERFDISAARKQAKIEDNVLNTLQLGAAYYVTDNLKLSSAVSKQDNIENENNYMLNASYQPSYFNNAISTSLSYNNNSISSSAVLSVSYYFDTKVSMIDRDRKY